ncbi:MAG: hypothetical protein IKJ08_03915 [Alistipes sp.]|nr:hypothetical protein [Alistipes sp.]
MKRFLFISMFVSMLGLGLTGCEYVEDYLDYSKLTILDDGKLTTSNASAYRDLKVTFNDTEHTSFGIYKIPNNTVVKLSWSYAYQYYDPQYGYKDRWLNSSAELMIGERETVIVKLVAGTIEVERK